jgi:hypothetical protein
MIRSRLLQWLHAILWAVAALTMTGRAGAGMPGPVLLRPVAAAPGPKGGVPGDSPKPITRSCRYPYNVACVYELPPKEYTFSARCDGSPGIRRLSSSAVDPEYNQFEARPRANRHELQGYNLSVARSADPSTCVLLQVFLLGDDTEASALPLFDGASSGGGRPENIEKSLGAQWSIASDELAAAGPVALVRRSIPPPPRLAQLITGEDTWFFVTPTSKDRAVQVTLPMAHQACTEGVATGTSTITFASGVEQMTIKVAAVAGVCDMNATKQRVVRVELDALGLFDAANPPASFWPATKNMLQLEPVDGADDAVGVRLKNDVFAQHHELLDRNFLAEAGGARGGAASCDTLSCRWEIPRASFDRMLAVKLDTPTTRELLGKGKKVYHANGLEVKEAEADLGTVNKWVLVQGVIPVEIGVHPSATTPLRIEPFLARLLSVAGRPIPCTREKEAVGAAAATVETITPCATFKRDASGGYFTLEGTALKVVEDSDRKLTIKLTPDVVASGISVANDNGDAVNLELRTDSCRYTFQQLTPAIAGTQDGEVLYWVESTPACLSAPLRVRPAGDEKNIVVKPAARWVPGRGREDRGRVLMISFSKIEGAVESRTLKLAATLSSADDGVAVSVSDGGTTIELRAERGIDDGAVRVDVEVPDGNSDPPKVIPSTQAFAVDLVNRLWFPRSIALPWRLRLTSLDHQVTAPPSPHLKGASLIVSNDPYVLTEATVDGRTAYFLEGTSATDGGLSLVAELEGAALDLLIKPQAVSTEAFSVLRKLRIPIYVGSASVTLGDRKTKRFWMPLDLRRGGSIWCPGSSGIGNNMKPGSPPRGLKRDEYRTCELRIAISQQSESVTPAACSCGAGAASPKPERLDEERFKARWGLQQLKVVLNKNDDTTEQTVVVLTEKDADRIESLVEVDEARHEKTTTRMIVFPLHDVLEKTDNVAVYSTFKLGVSHVQKANELRDDLKDAYVASGDSEARTEAISVRTILLPDWTTRHVTEGGSTVGTRYYFAATANLPLVRTRDKGFNLGTSTDYAKTVQASFGYGVVGVIEPWNFSTNDFRVPYLSPQLTAGILGPTDFNRRNWWTGFSGVLGLTVRLPAATKPEPGKVEAQTGVIVWGELTGGARDSVIAAILFGFNVNVGALSP